MKIRRKFCNLHGWAPHEVIPLMEYGWDEYLNSTPFKKCCRCHPDTAFTIGAQITAFFRGFKLPESIRAKDFLANHIKRISQ